MVEAGQEDQGLQILPLFLSFPKTEVVFWVPFPLSLKHRTENVIRCKIYIENFWKILLEFSLESKVTRLFLKTGQPYLSKEQVRRIIQQRNFNYKIACVVNSPSSLLQRYLLGRLPYPKNTPSEWGHT